jgi:GT2 family glycosyltransferase
MERTARIDGCVVIGRNEGKRLQTCLKSVGRNADWVVYTDSGSYDGSPGMARAMGVHTVELDAFTPFTAARGRNTGLERLLKICPSAETVQFVDGDCELFDSWFEQARGTLEKRPDVAAVFGRLRERHPEQSLYNRLCDMEWNTPVGEAAACGGIAMMRVRALRECGGFDEGLIAGEEPELCFRLRQKGWTILRIDADMGWHDAAMTRFAQWWKRSVRTGHAYAECSRRVGESGERFWVRETRSVGFWGLLLPATAVLLAGPTALWSLGLLAAYPALAARTCRFARRRGFTRADSALYALFCTLGKFPQAWGALTYRTGTITGQHRRLIEYK